jgi:hypothetical protein
MQSELNQGHGQASSSRGIGKETPIASGQAIWVRPLPVRDVLRLGPAADLWPRAAFSVVLATAVPSLVLLAVGRVDLMVYTVSGSTCALFGHNLPYAARGRVLACVVLGVVVSNGVGLATAAATGSTAVRVAVAALLAAVHKLVCEVTRIGPPGHVVFTFLAASCAFFPQRFADIPGHLALTLAAGALAWTVCMAPGLIRPQEPQRLAVARALDAAARLAHTPDGDADLPAARRATAAATAAAWRALSLTPEHSPERQERRAMALLLLRAESRSADPRDLARWAGLLRATAPLAGLRQSGPDGDHADTRTGSRAAWTGPRRSAPHDRCPITASSVLHPGSHVLLLSIRVAVGCVLAGWASMAMGVGHPYWSVVAAASIFQSSLTVTWKRTVNRVLGNLVGLALFAAILPITRTGSLTLVLALLCFQVATEATISRGYWLGQVFIVQMSLLMPEFIGAQPVGELLKDRALDTMTGCTLGLLVAMVIADRRAGDRAEGALDAVRAAHENAARLIDTASSPDLTSVVRARCQLATAVTKLHEAAEIASGEWWQRALPEERITAAEDEGRQMLALLAKQTTAAFR